VKERALKQAAQIRDELAQIERIISNVHADWNGFLRTGDDAYLKAVA
jgi:CHASE3 domain sensor protein